MIDFRIADQRAPPFHRIAFPSFTDQLLVPQNIDEGVVCLGNDQQPLK
jgi:hypothetical protein